MPYPFDINRAKESYIRRNPESYKGDYGHVLMATGSKGMCGAAILSASACLHAGAGLVTIWSDDICRNPIQTALPEAMFTADEPNMTKFDIVACGCGLGREANAVEKVKKILHSGTPAVLDADALNIIASCSLQREMPQGCVLTPHIGEFERLAGKCSCAEERSKRAADFAMKHKVYLVLKGHRSETFTPKGNVYINTSGNAGMATAGSGDVLCGIIASLLAQKYIPETAVPLGVFLHGLAGDFAAANYTEEYITARDIINSLPQAFKAIIN